MFCEFGVRLFQRALSFGRLGHRKILVALLSVRQIDVILSVSLFVIKTETLGVHRPVFVFQSFGFFIMGVLTEQTNIHFEIRGVVFVKRGHLLHHT